ncbi:DUF397 domain-containing protein [Streptomyces sp. NBC_01450]|uniref:DUF397 domain-containing protein n=1 Tax=Streptomyces sp. NBC_01450 TaxID=2903871 RepID=UPI002E376343|nr:DUF397 domain-containing protein [Streptomyces sp. NBC_01450]
MAAARASQHPPRHSPLTPGSANCVRVAATPTGTVRLRESDDPETILTTTPAALNSLIRTLKTSTDPRPADRP